MGVPPCSRMTRAQGGVEVARLRAKGGVAEALGEGGGVGDVGEEDDRSARRELWRLDRSGSPHRGSAMTSARSNPSRRLKAPTRF